MFGLVPDTLKELESKVGVRRMKDISFHLERPRRFRNSVRSLILHYSQAAQPQITRKVDQYSPANDAPVNTQIDPFSRRRPMALRHILSEISLIDSLGGLAPQRVLH